ncbi:MAG: hypothetical protein WCQ72_03715 [Eubacteriales bacterium]
MKKLISVALTALLVFSLACCSPSVTDEQARSILAGLIPKAEYLNDVFWGEGLAAKGGASYNASSSISSQYYEVSADCPYQTLVQLYSAAAEVYSDDYLKIISETAFDGSDDIQPRYSENDAGVLTVNVSNKGFELSTTLHPEKATVKRCSFGVLEVAVPCEFRGEPDEDYIITLVDEDGVWKLDSPTY